jgi:hypothetical protein
MFPHNVPLPEPKTSAKLVGGALHFLHLCTRVSQVRKVPDADLGWEDMYREHDGDSWFDWVSRFGFTHPSFVKLTITDNSNDSPVNSRLCA